MSLAWIMESSILYLVSVRMREVKIFIAASLVFFIGVIEQITVMLHIIQEDWFMFALLILMLISVFSSLVIIARGEQKLRTLYDILHIVSICIIGYGI